MTQEDKEQLLLKDLSGRLPYRVKGLALGGRNDTISVLVPVEHPWVKTTTGLVCHLGTGQFKPYLRPLSSMTEEEKEEFLRLKRFSVTVVMPNGSSIFKPSYIVDLEDGGDGLNYLYDWLNKNMFDYRGLIEKGLAFEAPEDMYNTKEK